jgi:hypothetical protein
MNKLMLAAAAALSLTGLAACGSGDTNTQAGRDAFLKGCTKNQIAGISAAKQKSFCTCAVDELRKKGVNTGDELTKAEKDKSPEWTAALQTCSQKYLLRGY